MVSPNQTTERPEGSLSRLDMVWRAVPDITARKTIIAAEMMPTKTNDYYTGLDRRIGPYVVDSREFTAGQYDEKCQTSAFPGFALLLVIFVVFMLFNRNRYRSVGADGSGGSLLSSLWLLSMLGGRGEAVPGTIFRWWWRRFRRLRRWRQLAAAARE